MKTRSSRSTTLIAVAAIDLLVLSAGVAWGADPTPATSSTAAPSKEDREKMAKLHEQMATCLRSDKSIADCRSEMMQSCRSSVGAQGCQMMGMGGRMGGGRGRMMQSPPGSGK